MSPQKSLAIMINDCEGDTTDEIQGRPPQGESLWHVEYFELKLLGKQQRQEGHSDPPLSP